MEPAVNFENLLHLTDGDREVIANLFTAFIESTDTCLQSLREALASGHEELWRQQAHALKGNSYILGADYLGGLCAQAQQSPHATPDDKKAILNAIESEVGRVRHAIDESLE